MDKIESFYFTREKMAQEQSTVLLEQLTELMEHKKIIQVCFFASIDLTLKLKRR